METTSKSYNKIKNRFCNKSNSSSNQFESDFFHTTKTYIHETAIVGPNVQIGENVKIGPFCTIVGNVIIKKNTIIYPNVSIGFPAQNLDTTKSLGSIVIGENCKIREFVSIGASKSDDGKTLIGNNCYIMSYSHVAHDVILEDNVTLINNVNLGGHVYVEKNAFLMANSASHQFCRIGQYCALAPFSAIRQDLPPFLIFSGMPAKYYGLNLIALKRAGFTKENISAIKHVAMLFYQKKLLLRDIKELSEKESEKWWSKDLKVKIFLDFIENSKRGVSKRIASKGHSNG